MASKKGGKWKGCFYKAKPASNIGACAFCHRAEDDEITYGKLYAIGDIYCHYFCALLSCCLVQRGSDDEGLFGFLYPDILAEIERSKKHRCSYCNREGANLGCSVAQCRKQYHLPCGRERNAVSLFYGNYKSYCVQHAPRQRVVESLMPKVRARLAKEGKRRRQSGAQEKSRPADGAEGDSGDAEAVCVICYEPVSGFPSVGTFWPPCCSRDAWLHRECLQRMALSAGMHYLKCPLCNDKEHFYRAVAENGYYIPDRDAAWELEGNAFADIYERPVACDVETCLCTQGRDHDADVGPWRLIVCLLCGLAGAHARCAARPEGGGGGGGGSVYVCATCRPAAPADLAALVRSIETVQLQEQEAESVRRGPLMSSRMSLRRTKQQPSSCGPSSSRTSMLNQGAAASPVSVNTRSTKTDQSRLELNLKKPSRRAFDSTQLGVDNSLSTALLSPVKLLEQRLGERAGQLAADPATVLDRLREELRRPRPLVVKRKIVNDILEELFPSGLHEVKSKEALKEWRSPKKAGGGVALGGRGEINEAIKVAVENLPETPADKEENKSSPIETVTLAFTTIDSGKERDRKSDSEHDTRQTDIEELSDTNSELQKDVKFVVNEEISKKNNKRKMPSEDRVPKKRRRLINLKLKRKARRAKDKDVYSIGNEQCDFGETNAQMIKDKDICQEDSCVDKTIVGNKIDPIEEAIRTNEVTLLNENIKEETKNKENLTEPEANIQLEKDLQDIKKEIVEEYDVAIDKRRISNRNRGGLNREKKINERVIRGGRRNVTKKKYFRTSSNKRDRGRRSNDKIITKTKTNKAESEIVDVNIKGSEELEFKYKQRRKISMRNKEIKVKIKWKKLHLKLKITKQKERKKKLTEETSPKVMKQYVLKYSRKMTSPKETIAKPENTIAPLKRKYIRNEKQTDNMVQTNIYSFFKATPKA